VTVQLRLGDRVEFVCLVDISFNLALATSLHALLSGLRIRGGKQLGAFLFTVGLLLHFVRREPVFLRQVAHAENVWLPILLGVGHWRIHVLLLILVQPVRADIASSGPWGKVAATLLHPLQAESRSCLFAVRRSATLFQSGLSWGAPCTILVCA